MANCKGVNNINSSNENFENKPAFIQNSFKLPLFNDEMEKELKRIFDWIIIQQIFETIINGINQIITVSIPIQVNKKLCANSDFNECLYNIALKGRYDVNELNIVSRKEFFAVNKIIRIIDFRLSAKKPIFTKHTSIFILYLMRQLQEVTKTNNSLYCAFLYRFLLELYKTDILIKENN